MAVIHGLFFFFQAEDGIRDLTVTGVQTCALPIYFSPNRRGSPASTRRRSGCARRVSAAPPPPAPDAKRIASYSMSSSPIWPSVDRKSTRLNSSHSQISYAVFCLKKKKKRKKIPPY